MFFCLDSFVVMMGCCSGFVWNVIVFEGRSDGFSPSLRMCSGKGGRRGGSECSAERRSKLPEIRLYRLEELLQKGRKVEAMEEYRRLHLTKALYSEWHYARLVVHFGAVDSMDAAEMIFEDAMLNFQPTTVMFNSLLQVFALAGLYDKAIKLAEKMDNIAVERDLTTYNHILRACFVGNNPLLAREVFEAMELKPNGETFSILIRGYNGDRKGIKRRWQEMLDVGLEPGSEEFTILIRALARCGDIRAAENAFSAMEWSFKVPREGTVMAEMLEMYGIQRNLAAVKALWFMTKIEGLDKDQAAMNAVVRAFANCDDFVSADEVLDQILGCELVRASSSTFMSLFKMHCRAGKVDRALCCLRRLEKRTEEAYCDVIHACTTAGYPNRANSAFKEMQAYGIVPTLASYNAMLKAKYVTQSTKAAMSWIRRMAVEGIEPDHNTFRIIITYQAKDGIDVTVPEQYLVNEADDNISLSATILSAVLAIYCSDKPLHEIKSTFGSLRRRGRISEKAERALVLGVMKRRTDNPQ